MFRRKQDASSAGEKPALGDSAARRIVAVWRVIIRFRHFRYQVKFHRAECRLKKVLSALGVTRERSSRRACGGLRMIHAIRN